MTWTMIKQKYESNALMEKIKQLSEEFEQIKINVIKKTFFECYLILPIKK